MTHVNKNLNITIGEALHYYEKAQVMSIYKNGELYFDTEADK